MKRVMALGIFIFGVCLLSSPIQAAGPAAVPAVAQSTLFFAGDLRGFFGDPNVAYLFLSLAILGLIIEIVTPGFYLPGLFGIIAAALAFYALGLLSVNPLGLTLIIIALPLFVFGAYRAAAFIPSTLAGIIALAAGSLCLFHTGLSIHLALITFVVTVMSIAFILTSNSVVKSQRRRVATGSEDLLNRTAVVRTPLEPSGTVMVEGELWQAELDYGQAQVDEEVVVTAIHGLKLIVAKKKEATK